MISIANSRERKASKDECAERGSMTKSVVHDRLAQLDDQFIKLRIHLLRRTDLKTERIDRLKTKLTDLLRAYIVSPLEIRKGESIFRARKHRDEEKQEKGADVYLPNVNAIYPQTKYIRRLGRANRVGQCIYYLAADEGIALKEVKPVVGDVVSILECKPINDATPSLIPIRVHQMAKEHGARIGGGFPEPEMRIKSEFQNDASAIAKHKLIEDFVVTEFLRVVDDGDEHLYKLTIAIAELLFSFEADLSDFGIELGPVDGLTYPSLASNQMNANLALTPDAFHRIYRPVACKRVTIAEIRSKTIKGFPVDGFAVAERIAKAVHNDGTIEW